MYPNIKRIKNTRLLINRLQYIRKKNNMQVNLIIFHLILFTIYLSPYLTTQSPTPKAPPFRQLQG